jgi:hypothetical protein
MRSADYPGLIIYDLLFNRQFTQMAGVIHIDLTVIPAVSKHGMYCLAVPSPGESPDPNGPELIHDMTSDPPSPNVQLGYTGCSLAVGSAVADPSTLFAGDRSD